jgi:hypothetical protein
VIYLYMDRLSSLRTHRKSKRAASASTSTGDAAPAPA